MTLKSYRLWDNLEKYGRGRKGHRWQYNTVHALFVLHQLRLHTHTRNTQYLLLFPSNNGCKNAPQNYVYTYVIRPLFLSNKYTRCTQWTIQKLPSPFLKVNKQRRCISRHSGQATGYATKGLYFDSWQRRQMFYSPKPPDRLRGPLSLIFNGHRVLFPWQ